MTTVAVEPVTAPLLQPTAMCEEVKIPPLKLGFQPDADLLEAIASGLFADSSIALQIQGLRMLNRVLEAVHATPQPPVVAATAATPDPAVTP